MRSHAWVLVVVVAFAVVALSALPTARADTSKPSWSTGDWWTYAITGEGGGTVPPLGNGTVRYDVVGTDTIQLGGNPVSAYHTRVNYTLHLTYGSTTLNTYLNGDEWFRTSDLAPARLYFSATVLMYSISVNASYDPPPDIHWPLTTGDQWSVSTTVSLVMDFLGSSNTTSSYETIQNSVGADTSITVAAGTFTATPVNQSNPGGYSLLYWSATAGNMVSQRSYDSSGKQMGSMDLQAYNYQGGGFLNISVLGIPLLYWLVLVAAVIVVIAAVVLVRRRRRRARAPPPPQPPAAPPGSSP